MQFRKRWDLDIDERNITHGCLLLSLTVACFGRLHGLETILTEQLFPASIPIEEQSRHWVLAFSTFDDIERKALQFILLQKQRSENSWHDIIPWLSVMCIRCGIWQIQHCLFTMVLTELSTLLPSLPSVLVYYTNMDHTLLLHTSLWVKLVDPIQRQLHKCFIRSIKIYPKIVYRVQQEMQVYLTTRQKAKVGCRPLPVIMVFYI